MKDWSNKVLESHKDFQSTLGKYTKNLDKKFKTDLNTVWNPRAFDNKTRALDEALATHFVREGLFDLETVFEQEAQVSLPDSFKAQFNEMFMIQAMMKDGNLEPAIAWAKKHSARLEKSGSALEFQLHRVRFIQLLASGNVSDSLVYAKAHLGQFSLKHMLGM